MQDPSPSPEISATDFVNHSLHHGIGAELHEVKPRADGIAATLIGEAHEREADLIVMGGYGHSRLREWLLDGTTYQLMQQAPGSLIIAH